MPGIPGAEDWQIFASVLAVIVFLAGGFVALRNSGIIKVPAPAAAAKPEPPLIDNDVLTRLRNLEKGVSDLRLHISECYIHRNDYIPNESRVIALLEKHSVMLARLEERIGAVRHER